MRNIKLIIQYIGTHYQGWQIQPTGPTIQAVFQQILSEICHEPIVVISSSRTDSGVHALGQVAHFKTKHPVDLITLRRALNARLPQHISVLSLEEVPLEFHAQKDAVGKTYTYFILNSEAPTPFLTPFSWRIYGKLDLDAMHRCLEMLVGEHDFKAFKAADSNAKTSVRKIRSIGIHRIPLVGLGQNLLSLVGLSGMLAPTVGELELGPERSVPSLIAIHIQGNGFLKHMVRNIVGTLMEVGRGWIDTEQFKKIFEGRDRMQAGMTAPAQGLFLVKVDYPA